MEGIMRSPDKTEAQLAEELEATRERLTQLEKAERRYRSLFEGIAENMTPDEIALSKSTPGCQMPDLA